MLDFNYKWPFIRIIWTFSILTLLITTTQSCTSVDIEPKCTVSSTCINIALRHQAMGPIDTLKINNLPYSGQAKESIAGGNITLYTNYKNGLKEDIEFGLYKNGKKSHVKYFIENKEHGEQKIWDDKASLIKSYSMKNGKLNGSFFTYDKTGYLKNERTFSEGIITSNTDYNANKEITAYYKVIDGRKYGLQGSRNCKSPNVYRTISK